MQSIDLWKFAEQVYGTVDFMRFAHGRQVGDGILKKRFSVRVVVQLRMVLVRQCKNSQAINLVVKRCFSYDPSQS